MIDLSQLFKRSFNYSPEIMQYCNPNIIKHFETSEEALTSENKPWYLLSPTSLTWWDKFRLLLGWKLFVRFDSSNGQCSAAYNISWAISRDKYVSNNMNWRWGNNWPRTASLKANKNELL